MISRTLRSGPSAHRALIHDLLTALEPEMQYLGWFIATARTYPTMARAFGWADAMEIASGARLALSVCESLLRTAHTARAQDLRPRLVRGGAISRASTRATDTTTRDCTSGRRTSRRDFQGVRALAPANVR